MRPRQNPLPAPLSTIGLHSTAACSCHIQQYFRTDISLVWKEILWCQLTGLTGFEQEKISELSSDRTFRCTSTRSHWHNTIMTCQEIVLSTSVRESCQSSFTTYLCERTFPAVTAIQSERWRWCSLRLFVGVLRRLSNDIKRSTYDVWCWFTSRKVYVINERMISDA